MSLVAESTSSAVLVVELLVLVFELVGTLTLLDFISVSGLKAKNTATAKPEAINKVITARITGFDER